MAVNESVQRDDVRILSTALLGEAKLCWGVGLSVKLAPVVITAVTVFTGYLAQEAPYIVAMLSILAELLLWRSDQLKGEGEELKRKLEFRDSFDWPISNAELSDLFADHAGRLQRAGAVKGLNEPYFASEAVTPSARRALENAQESAWWSKHLSKPMWWWGLAVSVVIVASTIALLVYSATTFRNFDDLANVGRLVTAVITLLFSLGLFRLTVSYYQFYQKADRTEERAKEMLATVADEPLQAIKLLSEYQLARAAAPLIPTWLWHARRDELNRLWAKYRRGSPGSWPQ